MKRKLLKATAIGIDVGAPFIATLTQFPLWVERSAGATVSGLALLFVILSIIPLFKYFKRFLQSPSAPIMWGIVLMVLLSLQSILSEMIVISFVGVVSNCIGWGLFKIAGEDTKQ